MAADASAYASLGLEPGADDAAIEQAYKRLIKEHHPDRAGGDAARAAEINRAYRDLRAERNLKAPLEINEWIAPPRGERAWLAVTIFLALATVFLLLAQGPLAQGLGTTTTKPTAHGRPIVGKIPDPMDQPLHLSAIDAAAQDALRLAHGRDEMALASASRDCHHELRTDPSLLQLDRCAAFDDAVVQLQDRDPLRDQGPFSELAVTGRLWSAATSLSEDSVAIDGRFDRIRLRVEFVLASETQPKAD
jgi:hypothetical protein